ncbi:hypothetical protein [Bacillus wiedmannii]|uniref:hypothetical protein n=1 Tax=Bacillus wiedmannii TaxID=1890302 RepID=UPI000ACC12E6|nr:hypothetical protein [Bacillus wiedmannii]MED3397635.1 hypothetical protein [Bacillus wiedmannii]
MNWIKLFTILTHCKIWNIVKKLFADLKLILHIEDCGMVHGLVEKYGKRKMHEEKLKWLIPSVFDHFELN